MFIRVWISRNFYKNNNLRKIHSIFKHQLVQKKNISDLKLCTYWLSHLFYMTVKYMYSGQQKRMSRLLIAKCSRSIAIHTSKLTILHGTLFNIVLMYKSVYCSLIPSHNNPELGLFINFEHAQNVVSRTLIY